MIQKREELEEQDATEKINKSKGKQCSEAVTRDTNLRKSLSKKLPNVSCKTDDNNNTKHQHSKPNQTDNTKENVTKKG